MAPAPSTKERVLKAFSEFPTYQDLLATCTSEWKDLEGLIGNIDKALQEKLEQLSAKEQAFEEKDRDSQQALQAREDAIPVREEAFLARVQEQKNAALAALEVEKSRYLGAPKENTYTMDVETASKEDAKADDNETGEDSAKKKHEEVRVRPQLKVLCENLDGEGVRKFIIDHRKEMGALRNELITALQSTIDPSRLVLEALNGYHLLEFDPSNIKETGGPANRRACILLLECLAQALADPLLGIDYPVVPPNIKESTKGMANLWKSKMDLHADAGNESFLNAHAFLQLLATFGIASEFDADELLKLVTAVSRRKQTPALCRSLGLADKMPDFVQSLNKDGKQLEALCFAHFFKIMDRVEPVPMLKAYLKEARRTVQEGGKNAQTPAAAKNESMMKELSAIKAILRAVEEYGLADQYPTDGLQKRLLYLEKAKADRKKAQQQQQQMQSKKPRIGGGGAPHTSSAAAYGQNAYDRRAPGNYGAVYGTGSRSPGPISSSYLYSTDTVGSSLYPVASAYSGLSGGYTGYQYGNGLVNPSAYTSSFLR